VNKIIRLYRWARFRHGHGVHSPFAFSFINDIVEEQYAYYGYKEIAHKIKMRKQPSLRMGRYRLKENLFLYRLSLKFNPTNIILLGCDSFFTLLYLQAESKTTHCTLIESNSSNITSALHLINLEKNMRLLDVEESQILNTFEIEISKKRIPQIVYIHQSLSIDDKQKAIDLCCNFQQDETVVIIDGINKDAAIKRFWKKIISNPSISVSFDLLEIGILVIKPKLKKQNYKLFF